MTFVFEYVVLFLCSYVFIYSFQQMEKKKKKHFMLQDVFKKPCCFLPAVYHHGPCVWRIASFHAPQEGQERSGVLWYPMVWPGCELELPHLSLLTGAILKVEMEAG